MEQKEIRTEAAMILSFVSNKGISRTGDLMSEMQFDEIGLLRKLYHDLQTDLNRRSAFTGSLKSICTTASLGKLQVSIRGDELGEVCFDDFFRLDGSRAFHEGHVIQVSSRSLEMHAMSALSSATSETPSYQNAASDCTPIRWKSNNRRTLGGSTSTRTSFKLVPPLQIPSSILISHHQLFFSTTDLSLNNLRRLHR
ncbi:hypothetical protein HAX54_017227 [Datura stramonium]|uniref:Uncharacterized protein n=1 Tax=Datura stramonium TaxID=4076 RepID=A0ABS8UKA2_DATST|nr:hypothetical protein [Datura stramonium]